MCDIPISYSQAVLGAEINVPTPDKQGIKYKIPEGTQTGTTFTIREKGFKNIQGRGVRKSNFQSNSSSSKKINKRATRINRKISTYNE